MQGELGTPIKVGIAIDPLERMRGLQTACPWRLHLLYVIPGAREMERALHMRLSGSRMEGEWFGGVAIPEFLQWMHDYCEWGIQNLRRTAELPPVPPHMKPKGKTANRGRRPIKAGGYDAKLGHHWRTDDGKDNPVTVRFVEPMP